MIEDGYTPSTKLDGEKVAPKPHSEWDDKGFAMVNLNSKAISCIVNGSTCSEFHNVMNLTCVLRKCETILRSTMREQ